ncbi:MAG: DUF308 domain-containing protein [Solirubrobacteraceae bacterium]
MSDPVQGLSPDDREAAETLASVWWVPLLSGVLTVIAGLVVLIEPHNSLLAIALVIGIYLVIAGIFLVAGGFARVDNRGIAIAFGLLAVIAGIFVIARPGSAVHGVRIVFGIFLVISGIAHLALAASIHGDRRTEIVRGLLELVAGIVFLAAPKLGLAAVALFFGVYLLLRGILELMLAFALRGAKKRLRAAPR